MGEALGEARSQVAARYHRLHLPSWPDPHPGMATPREQEYSRVTDPDRYAIVHARARLWTECLTELSGIDAEPVAEAAPDDSGLVGFVGGVRLRSSRPDTLPLLLLEHEVRLADSAESLAVLHISVARPDVVVAIIPDCACDACDSGSDHLLEAVDNAVDAVISGPFVMLKGAGWHARWHPGRFSSATSGAALGHPGLEEVCRRVAAGEHVALPPRTETFVGRAWLA